MKKKVITGLILAITLLALLGTTACDALGGGSGEVSQQLVEVTRGDLTVSVAGTGKIETSREARLTFGSGGKVASILVEEGDEVTQGDVLAQLDTSALEMALAQAQVALTQAEVAVAQALLARQTAEYGVKNIRDTEDALKLALLNAQINLGIAEDNLSDTIKTYGWAEWETVESELNKAKSYYESVLKRFQETSGESPDPLILVVERAKERLDAAQADYNNFLAGRGNTKIDLKKQQVEAAEVAATLAQKNLDELAEDIAIQELQVESANQSVEQARQSVELARLSVSDIQRQLDEATIVAPFDSLVAMVPAKEGDVIPSPSMAPTTIIHLINPDYLELVVEVDEIDIPLVELDQEAVVTVDALAATVFKGVVTAVYPVPKEVGGVVLYNVKVGLDVPENSGIKLGMSASADIVTTEHSNVLLVPSRAIGKNAQGETIVKVMSDKEVQERPVVVGLDDGLRTEIISGLREGETVVIETKARSAPSMGMF